MFKTIMKNQRIHFAVGIIALFVLEMFGSSLMDYNTMDTISLGEFLIKYRGKYCDEYRLSAIINACNSEWFYTLIAVIVGIPAVSFVHEQIKNGSLRMYESRMGRNNYIMNQILYCIVSSAIICLIAFGIYIAIAVSFFNIIPDNIVSVAGNDNMVSECISGVIKNYAYIILYGIMMSLLLVLIMYLYQDLLFDISLVFIISYKMRYIAMNQNFMIVIMGIIFLAVVYHVMWKIRGEKI